ncbi:S-adenosyl-L-methionine-dependent methyltransferase [Calocera cornea HHB12733]|uniref:S-adenosyl-L-methionine-dependent methyltransferase n=1 Tax=Calocera cornea HHB12733 TaxID=1353952 RepID=A0A165GZR9_9BASI|nr:S-adenosyl-L-methionine-dependent methyltransferase [Calocera cornea HHB12733]
MAETVLELAKLISDSAETINKACTENGTSVPSLDAPFDPRTEAFRGHADVSIAVNTAISAAYQLIATLRPAPASIFQLATSFLHSSALRVAFEANVSRIIKEAGGKGLHIKDIAAKADLDPKKLVRILRFLATHHFFGEVEPDVFANNRLSSLLDIGKPLSEIQSNPITKYEGTSGLQAVLSLMLDDSHKASAYAWETLHDSKTAFSEEPAESAFSTYIGNGKTYWAWLEEPGNAKKEAAMSVGMGTGQTASADAINQGFDFKSLNENDHVVDIGGGIGNTALSIARGNSSVRITVQDRAAVIKDGIEKWKQSFPEALSSGRVTFQEGDFFAPQSIKDASVFILRHILHDWSDKYCLQILSHLRAAATPSTKLLVMDSIMHYVCADTANVSGGMKNDAPAPLLPNWGAAGAQLYIADLAMLMVHNAQERTLPDLRELLKRAGWKIVRVYPDEGGLGSHGTLGPQVEAVPI